jgi:hypothetical protein
MIWEGYSSLKEQSIDSLVLVSTLIEELLIHASMLPPELRAKLDSYHADLANAIEAKTDSQNTPNVAPEISADAASVEEGGSANALCQDQPAQQETPVARKYAGRRT